MFFLIYYWKFFRCNTLEHLEFKFEKKYRDLETGKVYLCFVKFYDNIIVSEQKFRSITYSVSYTVECIAGANAHIFLHV